MGAFPLLGLDRKSWEPQYEDDLVSIKARDASDPFSRWYVEKAVPTFHHMIGERFKVLETQTQQSEPYSKLLLDARIREDW